MFKRKRSPVIEDLAEHLRSGPITFRNLETNGICELGFRYLGEDFRITWYSGFLGGDRDVALGGDRFFASSDDCRYLTAVARERADRLFDERVAELERKRTAHGTYSPLAKGGGQTVCRTGLFGDSAPATRLTRTDKQDCRNAQGMEARRVETHAASCTVANCCLCERAAPSSDDSPVRDSECAQTPPKEGPHA